MDLSNYRRSYEKSRLDETTAPSNPIALFDKWFHEMEASGAAEEVNAMTVSTYGLDGFPKSRICLLKQFTDDGFVFYTNYESEKGRAIEAEPRICLSFFWETLERQVIIKGLAEKVPAEVSDVYFQSRPRGSQLGALVSLQSQILTSRQALDDELSRLEQEYENKPVPRPQHWGGYLVRPVEVEFWQGRPNRIHDRIRYRKSADRWTMARLYP